MLAVLKPSLGFAMYSCMRNNGFRAYKHYVVAMSAGEITSSRDKSLGEKEKEKV